MKFSRIAVHGSSPLTRGKRAAATVPHHERGLIPAHAGKTAPYRGQPAWSAAHPRSRGENRCQDSGSFQVSGSSPLTRGKLCGVVTLQLKARLIPAHAGKTSGARSGLIRAKAHPRSRGENCLRAILAARNRGSSPLTRGKRVRDQCGQSMLGLIPAHAGKTLHVIFSFCGVEAHPRSRGENLAWAVDGARAYGSSPLTRGKPVRALSLRSWSRLIPAHAGKTLPDLRFYCADRSDLGNP